MLDFPRQIPRQRRAQHSVACILEASAQLLDRTYVGSVTTNHIAERAGVSIGTLYRYFDGKDEIFDSLARVEMRKLECKGVSLLNDTRIESGNALVDEFVEIAVGAFDNRPRVRKNLHQIIGDRSVIAKELQIKRLRFCRLIGDRLRHVEPKRFRMLESEERLCIVMAWRSIINDTLEEDALRFHRPHIKRLLSATVLSYFQE